jgi:hypothetical protein
MSSDMSREAIFDRAHKAANEIAQIFVDANHWNELHPDEAVHPDPDGQLRRAYNGLAAMLASEPDSGRRFVLPLIWSQP